MYCNTYNHSWHYRSRDANTDRSGGRSEPPTASSVNPAPDVAVVVGAALPEVPDALSEGVDDVTLTEPLLADTAIADEDTIFVVVGEALPLEDWASAAIGCVRTR